MQQIKRVFIIIIIIGGVSNLLYSQNISQIKFEHSSTHIINDGISILFQPIKNNRKGKVKVYIKKDQEEEFTSRISKKKYFEIYNAIRRIKLDTIAVLGKSIDGTVTSIEMDNNLNSRKKYYADALTKKSQTNEFQKDFWYATLLIIKAAGLTMEELAGYR